MLVQALINAERECTEHRDIVPDRVLRPIGTIFKEWSECTNSTDLPHWIWWKVTGEHQTFVGRRGDIGLYERHEEIQGIEEPESFFKGTNWENTNGA